MHQPGASVAWFDPEARVRFAQAQPPSVLGLSFIAAEELDEESGELFRRAPEALAWEQPAELRVLADALVKRGRKPPATRFAAHFFQQSSATAHDGDCTWVNSCPP